MSVKLRSKVSRLGTGIGSLYHAGALGILPLLTIKVKVVNRHAIRESSSRHPKFARKHALVQTPAENIYRRVLIAQRDRLGDDHIQIAGLSSSGSNPPNSKESQHSCPIRRCHRTFERHFHRQNSHQLLRSEPFPFRKLIVPIVPGFQRFQELLWFVQAFKGSKVQERVSRDVLAADFCGFC
jgi:hypothetical protein